MGQTLRVGIISANWGMSAHLPAWRANQDVEVVGVCTAHRETAEAAAKEHGIPMPFWDYRAMAEDPNIDVIDVGTRPNLRYDMGMAALEGGKHVYAGVPLADSLEHARDLLDASRRHQRVASVDAYSEYMPPIALAKELVEDGAIGDLFSLTCRIEMSLFNAPTSTFPYNWFWNRAYGCSALRNLGSHALNILYFLFGEIEEVVAQDEMMLKEWRFVDTNQVLYPQVEDTSTTMLRFRRGGMGMLSCAWAAVAGGGFQLDMFGSKGRILLQGGQMPMPSNDVTVARAKVGETAPSAVAVPDRLKRRDGVDMAADTPGPLFAMALAFADIRRAIAVGGDARPSFAQGFHTHAVIEAAHRSAVEHRWITVRDLEAGGG